MSAQMEMAPSPLNAIHLHAIAGVNGGVWLYCSVCDKFIAKQTPLKWFALPEVNGIANAHVYTKEHIDKLKELLESARKHPGKDIGSM